MSNMKGIAYYNPVQILSGEGCLKTYQGFRTFGARCMIVCSRTAARISGAFDDARAALDASGVSYTVFDRVEPNPLVQTCCAAGREAREMGAEFILGIGGGSPLDAAKAIAVFARYPDFEPEDIFKGTFSEALPVCAVGTTAGTGSEVTQYSVLTVPSIANKKSVASPLLFPKIAFLDPNYTNTLPFDATIATAIDALCHAIEGYFSLRACEITDALALRAMALSGGGLRALLRGELDSELRARLLYGSTVAGMVIAGTGTGFVHAMGYPLTYFDGIPHGAANGYFIADFLELMSLARPDKEEDVYRMLEISDIREFRALMEQALPNRISLTRDKVQQYTKSVCKSRHLTSSVFEVTEDVIYDLYKQYMK